jgi:hypothetical protein
MRPTERARQRLLMHKAAAELARHDPAVAEQALAIVRGWLERSGENLLWRQWVEMLEHRDWDRALEDNDYGDQLRQASTSRVCCYARRRTRR